MEKELIYQSYFPKLVKDYLSEKEELISFYNQPPTLSGLLKTAENKQFSQDKRNTLCTVLLEQHDMIGKIDPAVSFNIESLKKTTTFTVTTGHQICLMTGPLYFIFKIASAVKLANELKAAYPQFHFVPVYWAATEDHDFEEIQSFFLNGKSYTWTPTESVSGAVGKISTHGIDTFFSELEHAEGDKLSLNSIYQLLKKAWTEQPDLSSAIRKAVHDLFGHHGVVSLDPNHQALKKTCTHWLSKELQDSFSYSAVKNSTEQLEKLGYKTQIEPREINLFYLKSNLRERIVKNAEGWEVLNTETRFTESEINEELNTFSERFSPNVVLRPLYQESVLPNIAYIGGSAEMVYWLQLKKGFDFAGVPFPVLIPRDGFLFARNEDITSFQEWGLNMEDILSKPEDNLRKITKSKKSDAFSISEEKEKLKVVFSDLKKRYETEGDGAIKAFSATEKKLEKELEKLEKKAIRFAASQYKSKTSFLQSAHEKWFPSGVLAERKESIINHWGLLGSFPIDTLVEKSSPLTPGLKIIRH